MKKVLAVIAGFIFGAFGIGVLALLMSLTYQALQKLFPNSLQNQMWGMIVYDIAAICWAGAFVFKSKSVVQYGAAAFGFLIALIGTLGMVAAEVMLGGQQLIPAEMQRIGQWMVYGFIGVTILHVIMLYTHHGAAPDIWETINLGISRSTVTDAAMKQATKRIEQEQAMLAESIADEIVDQVKRDLNLPIPIRNTVFDRRKKLAADTVPLPIIEPAPQPQDEPKPAKPPFPGSPSE